MSLVLWFVGGEKTLLLLTLAGRVNVEFKNWAFVVLPPMLASGDMICG
jgi:hypothetical protein